MTEDLLPFERIERTVLERQKAKTDPKFGSDPNARPIDLHINYGIINVNKPKGPTSHQVSSYLQKILSIKKSGHSGTLDPKVTGVLPVATGGGTKVVQMLLTAGKEYVCIMHLHKPVDEPDIRKVCASFVGKIKQLPPIKSAVKREWRYRKVYYLNILEIDGQDVLFRIGCQAGTYIRKICHDIGQELKVGAHMTELVRTKAGPFTDKDWVSLQDLADAMHYHKAEGNEKYIRHVVKPIEHAVRHLPHIWVSDTTVDPLCHGANLALPGICKVETEIQVGEDVAVMSLKDELICIGIAMMKSRDMLGKSGIGVKTNRVFMIPGTYPKYEKEPVLPEP